MNNLLLKSERGFATLIALLMVGMLTLLGIAALSTSDDEVNIAGNAYNEMRTFYAAEGGLEAAAAALQTEWDSTGVPPMLMPTETREINNCVVTYGTADNGPATQDVLSTGTLTGLHALVKSFTITSVAVSQNDHGKMELSQTFQTALVPLFQFAVFYENDLEIAPGPAMTLAGRVHSNGNLWLQAATSLQMDSYVTSAGSIYHGRKGAGSVASGDVTVKDLSGADVSMKDGADWLDADDSHWYDSSVTRWQGMVQDSEHGQEALNIPLNAAAGGDPHKLIDRGSGNPDSYEHHATLKFIDGQALQLVGGIWNDVTANMITDGVISFSADQFTDQRENAQVDVMELDIDLMYSQGYAPSSGVIYFADSTSDYPALRLRSGSQLDAGLTVASANPVYTLGNYNSVDKKPAAILADAVTFLSGSWDDSKSAMTKSDRIATNTTVNASYLTGNIETTDANYNGGFENLPRFLEEWSGRDFNWLGSAVCLWNSVQANGLWNGTYYSPPDRNWAYDPDLNDPNKLPPETPMVRVFQRIGWQQKYVGPAN
jgi:Tfp pilus assembly protein PilX